MNKIISMPRGRKPGLLAAGWSGATASAAAIAAAMQESTWPSCHCVSCSRFTVPRWGLWLTGPETSPALANGAPKKRDMVSLVSPYKARGVGGQVPHMTHACYTQRRST